MVFPETGNTQLHIAGKFGGVKHPDFFKEKYKIKNKYEL